MPTTQVYQKRSPASIFVRKLGDDTPPRPHWGVHTTLCDTIAQYQATTPPTALSSPLQLFLRHEAPNRGVTSSQDRYSGRLYPTNIIRICMIAGVPMRKDLRVHRAVPPHLSPHPYPEQTKIPCWRRTPSSRPGACEGAGRPPLGEERCRLV